jgi:tyrosyl-tRNA synthetase
MPILVGLDGQRKMSKSLGNYVGITQPPSEMFGRLMSISDEMMWPYFDLVTDRTPDEVTTLAAKVKSGAIHPMDAKMSLAQEIIAGFHGVDAAAKAAAEFQRIFRDREAPEEAPVRKLPRGESKRLTQLLVELGLAASRSEADRLVKQGGVELDGVRVTDVKMEVDLAKPREFLLRAGKKKFLRIIVE